MVDGKGNTLFMLPDAQFMSAVMVKGADKRGTLPGSGLTPDGKRLQVHTLGMDGDTQSTEDADHARVLSPPCGRHPPR